MEKKTWGGRREGAGRKPKDPNNPVNDFLGIAVSSREKEAIQAMGPGWARQVLRRSLKRQGVKI